MREWTPDSWQTKTALQQPTYPDQQALAAALEQVRSLPPLVTSWEIESLKSKLAEAADGDRFVLQGGDCAESFDSCDSDSIANKLKILLQMSLVLLHGTHKPIVRVGRFAGQYAKPRSADTETRDGVTLPAYRGDLVNRAPFDVESRTPDPTLMLRAYERSALTLNFIRALVDGGFADLHHPEYWDLSFMEHSPKAAEFHRIVDTIGESIQFLETLSGTPVGQLRRVDFYTSHEGLHLYYESAQTRQVPRRSGWYNLSTHLPWIGQRTAGVDGAHVEYFRGIRNPIGVKIGPGMTPDTLVELVERLDPEREAGRLTLIHRFGAHQIARELPDLVRTVDATDRKVVWMCDPMHGNTEKTSTGVKTRKFEHILAELEQAFEIHATCGSNLGGVHIELTGEDVTECTGGARGLHENDLARAYRSTVDPRLNYEQALELALLIAKRV